MVDAALEFTIHNLREKFRETFVLEHDVTEKIRQIAKSVQLLRSHLSDAQVTQASGGMMTIYERDIREIIHWFDRVQQKFAIVAASGGGRLSRFFKRLVPVGLKDLREIYIDIRKAEYRVDYFIRLFEESIRRRSYAQLTGESSRAASYLSKRSLRREEGFVGMEEEVEVLWSCIKEPQIRVIGICGMGGLGKTTLASRLFQDKRVRSLFPHLAWVFVSPDFEPRRIFEDVLKQLGVVYPEESVADMNAAEMARRLYNVQQEVPCLIVLDDLWSADGWRALSVAFPSGDTRSKILITTRVGQVVETAEIAAARRYIHKTRCLNPDEGWQLFMKTIGNQDLITDMGVVEMVGQKMVKYCEGLPLAIMNFADHFLRQRQEPSDESMQDERYIQSVVRDSQEEGSILESLALSYNNLPHFLRHCFLYLGHFQEHSPIQAEKLYLFWLAEGLLSLEDCGEEETLLNVADRYLDELAQRSMIEVHEEEVPTVTRFSSCQLRQPIRDLCLVKNKDEGYFRFVDFRNESQSVRGLSSSYRLHINLDGYEHGHGFRLKDAEKKEMRCLLISAKENQKELVWPHDLSSLVKFKYLRVLDFMGISFQGTQTLEGIGKLVHLMYLSFEDCTLPELPSSIGKLELLCVLDLRVINTMIIPDVLWKLKKLKHLYFPESFGTHGARKLRLDGLTDLETVINLNLNMCNVRDLFKLYNLRYVGLNVPGYLEEIEHIVERMNMSSNGHLLRVSVKVTNKFDCYTEERVSAFKRLLGCHSLIILCLEGHIRRLPLLHEFSSNLAKIVLVRSELTKDPMPTLEKLPKLRALVLDVDAFIGKKMVCSASGFTELRRLELSNLHYLEKWIVEDKAMLQLSNVVIVNCQKLMMKPEELEFVRHLPQLQQIRVSGMCKEFKDSISMVKDMYKVQHVPSITIEN